jgi:hypothetical protein
LKTNNVIRNIGTSTTVGQPQNRQQHASRMSTANRITVRQQPKHFSTTYASRCNDAATLTHMQTARHDEETND